jgi:hypothetical protein
MLINIIVRLGKKPCVRESNLTLNSKRSTTTSLCACSLIDLNAAAECAQLRQVHSCTPTKTTHTVNPFPYSFSFFVDLSEYFQLQNVGYFADGDSKKAHTTLANTLVIF